MHCPTELKSYVRRIEELEAALAEARRAIERALRLAENEEGDRLEVVEILSVAMGERASTGHQRVGDFKDENK